jgi:hypothetical protein
MTYHITHAAISRFTKQSIKILIVILLLTQSFIGMGGIRSASALSQSDLDAMYSWPLWNPATCNGTTIDVQLSGSTNQLKVWNFLKQKGLSDAQAAGIMGNIMQESHFDPILAGDPTHEWETKDPSTVTGSNAGWGIVQWTPGAKIISIANSLGINPPQPSMTLDQFLATELQIMWKEVTGTAPTGAKDLLKGLQAIKGNTPPDAAQAARYFVANFESGTDPGGVREAFAVAFLQKYAGISGGPSSSSSSSGTGAGCGAAFNSSCNVSTGQATGDGKILCEAEKYKGAFYTFGGGPHGQGGYTAFSRICPEAQIANLASKSTAANPGGCSTDCSGLVSAAIDGAFNLNLGWTVSAAGIITGTGPGDLTEDWQQRPITQAKPGDIVTLSDATGHVEIVDHVEGASIVTFGTRETGTPASRSVTSIHTWNHAWHWTGPGASS